MSLKKHSYTASILNKAALAVEEMKEQYIDEDSVELIIQVDEVVTRLKNLANLLNPELQHSLAYNELSLISQTVSMLYDEYATIEDEGLDVKVESFKALLKGVSDSLNSSAGHNHDKKSTGCPFTDWTENMKAKYYMSDDAHPIFQNKFQSENDGNTIDNWDFSLGNRACNALIECSYSQQLQDQLDDALTLKGDAQSDQQVEL